MNDQVESVDENQASEVGQQPVDGSEERQGDQASSRPEKRVQQDMLRYKQEFKAAEERNQKLQNEIKAMEERSLAEKSNYKELYERKNEELNALRSERDNDQTVFFNSIKNSEIEKEAIKVGIRAEALEDVRRMSQDGVITETTSTGHVNVLGAKEFVDGLKQTRPFWFNNQGPPAVNTGNPGYNAGKPMSATDILKLQTENPAKYKEIMMKKFS